MEFFNYLKIATSMPQSKRVPLAPLLTAVVIYCLSIILYGRNSWLPLVAVFAFFICVMLFCTGYNSPNLEAVFPVNYKKKLFYRFMATLFMFVTVTVAMFAIAFVVIVLVQAFDKQPVSELFAKLKNSCAEAGVYGCLYGVAYIIILYSAGMITGFIKRRKVRNIYLVCLCAALFLCNLFIMLPYYVANHTFNGGEVFLQACYNAMALPWLCIVIMYFVAFACLGASIYLGVKYYNPKKF